MVSRRPDSRRRWCRAAGVERAISVALVLLLMFSAAPRASADDPDAAYRPVLAPQSPHVLPITCAALAPDGGRVATGSEDHTVAIWKSTGWAPSSSTGGASGGWESWSPKKLGRCVGHVAPVRVVAFSPDGATIASGSDDGTVRLWEPDTGREVLRIDAPGAVKAVTFSHGGTRVLVGASDGTTSIYRTSGGRATRVLSGHRGAVVAVALSPDGRTVATASLDGTARLWSGPRWDTPRVLGGHAGGLSSVAFSPDGRLLVTGTRKGEIRLWDVTRAAPIRTVSASWADVGDGAPVPWMACFSRDGRDVLGGQAVSGGSGQALHAWAVAGGEGRVLMPLPYLWAGGCSLSASPDRHGTLLWYERKFCVHPPADPRAKAGVIRWFHRWASGVSRLLPSRDGRRLLARVGSVTGSGTLWDLARGRPVGNYYMGGALAVAASGRFGLFGDVRYPGGHAVVRCVDLDTEQPVRILEQHDRTVVSAALSEDGSLAVTADAGGTVLLWSPSSDAPARRLEGHDDSVWETALSPDERHLLTVSQDGEASIWNVASGRSEWAFREPEAAVNSGAFHPRGKWFFTGSSWGDLRCWSLEDGAQRWYVDTGPSGVAAVRASPDGAHLLTTQFDGTVAVRRSSDGAVVRAYERHPSTVRDAAWSPDGTRFLTAAEDGLVRVFDASRTAALCSFREDSEGWAVWDPDGRFDTRGVGSDVLAWRSGSSLLPLARDSLWDHCHEPGLLARHLGLRDGGFKTHPRLDQLRPAPALEVRWEAGQRLALRLTNLGGGLGRVEIRADGDVVVPDARGAGFDAHAADASVAVDLRAGAQPGEARPRAVEVRAHAVDSGAFTSRVHLLEARPANRAATDSEPTRPRLIAGHPAANEVPATSADGRWGVTPDPMGGPARVWDCRRGRIIRRLESGCAFATDTAISPDGRWVAVVGRDAPLQIWDWRTREVCFEHPLEGPVSGLTFVENPLRLVWVEYAGQLVYGPRQDVRGGGPLRGTAHTVALDADGRAHRAPNGYPLPPQARCLAAARSDAGSVCLLLLATSGDLNLVEFGTGKVRRHWPAAVPKEIHNLLGNDGITWEFGAEGRRPYGRIRGDVVLIALPGFAGAWRLSTGVAIHRSESPIPASAARQPPTPLASNGSSQVVYAEGRALRWFDASTEAMRTLRTFDRTITALDFDASGARVYVSLGSGLVEVEVADGTTRRLGSPAPRHASATDALSVEVARRLPPRDSVSLVGWPGYGVARSYQVWSLRDGRPVASGTLPALQSPAVYVEPTEAAYEPPLPRISANGRFVARFPERKGGLELRPTAADDAWGLAARDVTSCAFDPSGAFFVYVRRGEAVTVDLETRRERDRVPVPQSSLDTIRRVTTGAGYALLCADPEQGGLAVDEFIPPVLLHLGAGAGAGRSHPLPPGRGTLRDVSIDGTALLIDADDRSFVFDLESGRERCWLPVVGAELSGDGRVAVVSAHEDYGLLLFDTTTGRALEAWDTDP